MGKIFNKLNHKLHRDTDILEAEVLIPTYKFYLNSPKKEYVTQKQINIEGWILPDDTFQTIAVRVKNNDRYFMLKHGLKRFDVAKEFIHRDKHKALHSGFMGTFEYEDGSFEIEADLGSGWQTVHSNKIAYSPENLVGMIYEPDLSQNSAEHQNLLENKKKYYHELAHEKSYVRDVQDPRLVALYLPQFHPIPENDVAWGKGFTEWTNVAGARARFVGHQQPILPADLGFYDLRVEETIYDQIELAKKNGIYGFCFYYYWFSGKRLLNKPLDIFLKHKEWDFNFMISWANENWTKRWDGLDNDVIVAQQYLKNDPLNFIQDVEDILLDPRYIKENGKPVLIVYRGSQLKDPTQYIKVWRSYFKDKHDQQLHIVSVLGFEATDPRAFGFDAGMEFEPLTIAKRMDFNAEIPLPPQVHDRLLDGNFTGGVMDYRQAALNYDGTPAFDFPTHKSIMPSWDNDARKKGNGPTVVFGSNPDIYAHWLENLIRNETKHTQSPLLFINAWNEWAEGAVLEPTQHLGHGYLNRTSEVLARLSKNKINRTNLPMYGITRFPTTELAVVIHVYYEKEWSVIVKKLRMLDGIQFDIFVTVTAKNQELISTIRHQFPKAYVYVAPNRGRDMLPFMFLLPRLKKQGYQYLLKLHTKKSTHRDNGAVWFESLLTTLMPSPKTIKAAIDSLSAGTALIGPAGHYVSLKKYMGSNQAHSNKLLKYMFERPVDIDVLADNKLHGYFAGSMFWARIDAIEKLADLYPIPEDFEAEKGQIDGTLSHAIERLISIVPLIEFKRIQSISNDGIKNVTEPNSEYGFAE